jgi:2-iminobutanoate/2-iminopropanoate deaminase
MEVFTMIKIHTEKAPAAVGPYSQAIVSKGMVYTSGQIAIDPVTNTVTGTTIEEQTEQIMRNLGAVLETAGSGFDKAVKTTCFLADMNDFAAFNEIYGKYFTSLPARSCVAVKTLPKGVLAEVEVIAESNL